MSLSKFENKFTAEDALGRVGIALLGHPFDYVRILIQLGYEPMPPYPTKTIFGKQRLALPGVIKYIGYIRRSDGFFGLYRGITYKIATTLTNGFVYVNVNDCLKQVKFCGEAETKPKEEEDKEDEEEDFLNKLKIKKLLDSLLRETLSRFIALSVSYPFHLMTIRICAQFVGKETVYNSLFGGVKDIYQNSGITGFYAGFMPRFLGDCVILWVGSGIIFVINSCVKTDPSVKGYIAAAVNLLVSSFTYPFHLVSTVMCCNGYGAQSLNASRLTGPEYLSWIECWQRMSELGQLKRGSSLIWRYHNQPFIHQYIPIRQREFKHW